MNKRPACLYCHTTFRTQQVGVSVLEVGEDHNPVGVWQSDILECPDCGVRILWGWGDKPWSVPTDEGFKENALRASHRFRS